MKNNAEINKLLKENRSFGIVLMILLIIFYLLVDSINFYVNLTFGIIGFIVILITYYIPNILKKPNAVWMKFGLLLGNVTSFIVLSIIFLVIFAPIGAILRLTNVLGIKVNYEDTDTYWIKRNEPIQSMKQQY